MQKVVADLSEVLGWADAIQIVRKWGGRDLNVPKTLQHGDALALALGYDAALRLVRAFGGERLQLPSERNALLDMRNEAIASERAGGGTLEAIALRYGLTRQAVGYIVKKMAENTSASICGASDAPQTTQSGATI